MKEIRLPKGQIVLVDDADFEEMSKYSWYLTNSGYAMGRIGSRAGGIDQRKSVYMHRLLMDAPKGLQVDHINRNKLDNRRENLRLATWAQNQQNSRTPKNNKTGYKGVYWLDKFHRYEAAIKVNNKKIYLGRFKTALEAAKIYNEAALKYHGEFARLNEICPV